MVYWDGVPFSQNLWEPVWQTQWLQLLLRRHPRETNYQTIGATCPSPPHMPWGFRIWTTSQISSWPPINAGLWRKSPVVPTPASPSSFWEDETTNASLVPETKSPSWQNVGVVLRVQPVKDRRVIHVLLNDWVWRNSLDLWRGHWALSISQDKLAVGARLNFLIQNKTHSKFWKINQDHSKMIHTKHIQNKKHTTSYYKTIHRNRIHNNSLYRSSSNIQKKQQKSGHRGVSPWAPYQRLRCPGFPLRMTMKTHGKSLVVVLCCIMMYYVISDS